MKSFLKTPEKSEGVSNRREEALKSKPFYDKKLDIYFVNGSKLSRAHDILALINGERVPIKKEEEDRREHYFRLLTDKHGIDPKSEEALPAVYELLGGLIRTPGEQKEAEKNAEEMRKKGKKDTMGIKGK